MPPGSGVKVKLGGWGAKLKSDDDCFKQSLDAKSDSLSDVKHSLGDGKGKGVIPKVSMMKENSRQHSLCEVNLVDKLRQNIKKKISLTPTIFNW